MEKEQINQSMTTIDPNKAVSFIIENAPKYAEAKSQRVYLENFLKVKKAQLMQDCKSESSISRMETYALSHPEYLLIIDGIKIAMLEEEKLRWFLEAARLRVELFRTIEASNRQQDRATR
jgi:hypothetical protein